MVLAEQKQLSLCVITKNEEAFFPGCLNDMKEVADEMLVADLGSGGRSSALVRQAGAEVYQPAWEDDFSKIKNFCLDHAAGQWVLFLQADEVVSLEQRKELKVLMQNPGAEGYLFDLDDGGKGVSSPTQLLRLIRNRKNYRFRYRSYESIPEEELYSLQSCALRITRRGEKTGGWQMEERRRLLQTDVKEHPQDGYLRYLLGIELMNQGKFEESADAFGLARRAFNGGYLYVPHLYKCLGLCLSFLGRHKEAEEVLSEGFLLFPFYTDLLVLRAELYRRLGRGTEVLKDLKTCLALQKSPSACVPEPETDRFAVEKMLAETRAGLSEEL